MLLTIFTMFKLVIKVKQVVICLNDRKKTSMVNFYAVYCISLAKLNLRVF